MQNIIHGSMNEGKMGGGWKAEEMNVCRTSQQLPYLESVSSGW